MLLTERVEARALTCDSSSKINGSHLSSSFPGEILIFERYSATVSVVGVFPALFAFSDCTDKKNIHNLTFGVVTHICEVLNLNGPIYSKFHAIKLIIFFIATTK